LIINENHIEIYGFFINKSLKIFLFQKYSISLHKIKYMKMKFGSTRFVFVFNKFVIKFPIPVYRRCLYGLLSNIEENYKYHNKNEGIFCPIYFCFPLGLFLIMKKAEEITKDEFSKLPPIFSINEDFYLPNIGKIENNYYYVDYGVKQITIRKSKITKYIKRILKINQK